MSRRPRTCPECGSDKVAEILYGLISEPVGEELDKNPENHRYVLGGCCVQHEMPRWRCCECSHDWGTKRF